MRDAARGALAGLGALGAGQRGREAGGLEAVAGGRGCAGAVLLQQALQRQRGGRDVARARRGALRVGA